MNYYKILTFALWWFGILTVLSVVGFIVAVLAALGVIK